MNNNPQQTFALILETDDEVMACLKTFATKQKLPAASFTFIGAFSETTVGFFNFEKKDHEKIDFNEQMEVFSITGDISMYKDRHRFMLMPYSANAMVPPMEVIYLRVLFTRHWKL
ncbi:putative DNA-binding protein with PD1-like motif [Mucilaginibacter sp. SG564]|nr:DUF296 domain-containing protein [Mucilaginibacter sp. SG564]NOW97154.1 putative DNA-binding protein with PD1-like motif [Mucilaginibacter sp. SG564]